MRHLQGFRNFDSLVRDREVCFEGPVPLRNERDKNCEKKSPVAADADLADSSPTTEIYKLPDFNVNLGIRLTGSRAIIF